AYFAFATQVKTLCGIFESDSAEVGLAKLRESVPDETVASHLAILLGLDPDGSVDDREELFFSVRVFIEGVARDGPTLLVFEDIHWADRGLLDLIELLAARLRDLPVMLVTLARPELLDSRPSWGGGLTAYTALPLAPLSADEAHELANLRLGEIRTEAAMRLAETAEGNPLFIEQLAATVAESSPAGASLPSTIRGLLAARLDALPAAERALLLDAAVVGKTFWRGALPQIDEAAEPVRALGYFIRAAEQAERGWAKDQAAILYREALELVPEGDGSQLADLRRRLAIARAASFHIPDARQLMR